MRWILRQLIYHATALLIAVYLIPGFSIGNSFQNIVLATAGLSVINVFIKPILKILFLPLNIITLNFFSLIINMGVVFALTKFVPTVTITTWDFKGMTFTGFVIPAIHFTFIYTLLAVSVLLTTIVSFLNWLAK